MSRTIRLGMAAGLALAASAAWAAAGRLDEKSAGGDVWYDEFYTAARPRRPRRPLPPRSARGPRASTAAGQPANKSARGADRATARGDHRRLARNR